MVPKLGLFVMLFKPGAKGGGLLDAKSVGSAADGTIAGVGSGIELGLGPSELVAGKLGRLPGGRLYLGVL
jgi:hypothetical protein